MDWIAIVILYVGIGSFYSLPQLSKQILVEYDLGLALTLSQIIKKAIYQAAYHIWLWPVSNAVSFTIHFRYMGLCLLGQRIMGSIVVALEIGAFAAFVWVYFGPN